MPHSFSVAMCTYNGARHVGEQLASFAAQTRPPFELVVCDDRSTDETVRAVREFAESAPFPVRLFVNERNLGSTKNFGRAIELCEGELIALSDQDDVWDGRKLERLGEEFERDAGVGLVFTDAEVVDESLRPLGRGLFEMVGFGGAQQRLVRGGRALEVLLPGWTVTGATLAFRAKFKGLVLEMPEDLSMIHDGWIALVVASVARVAFVAEPLIKYRQHAGQQLGAPKRESPPEGERPGVRERLKRVNSYGPLIENAERVRERLAARRALFDVEEALAGLEERARHMRARASMPARRLGRLKCILEELRTRRYHVYSSGWHSALKDLLA
jgi:glycosyltransferase involved in cell wall biosynthesis